jgi:hypothetical protein
MLIYRVLNGHEDAWLANAIEEASEAERSPFPRFSRDPPSHVLLLLPYPRSHVQGGKECVSSHQRCTDRIEYLAPNQVVRRSESSPVHTPVFSPIVRKWNIYDKDSEGEVIFRLLYRIIHAVPSCSYSI